MEEASPRPDPARRQPRRRGAGPSPQAIEESRLGAPPEPEAPPPDRLPEPIEAGPGLVSLPVFLGFAGGLLAGVSLALLAFLAFYLLREDADGTATPGPLALPSPIATAASSSDVQPRTAAALIVHLGPDTDYAALGTLGRGEAVQIVGRNQEATWLAVRFPPGSTATGWVPLSGVSGVDDVQGLAVAFPTPLPLVPFFPTPAGGLNGAPPGSTPTPSPTPVGLPDLVVTALKRLADGRVAVIVSNEGATLAAPGSIRVRIADEAGAGGETVTVALPTFGLQARASLTLTTSVYTVTTSQTVVATVNPDGAIAEKSLANNTLQVTIDVP